MRKLSTYTQGVSELHQILKHIRHHPDCIVLPASWLPRPTHHQLPDDVQEFYTLCGGVEFFSRSDVAFPFRIVTSARLFQAGKFVRCLATE